MDISLEEFGRKVANEALDGFVYKGLTLREWADKITNGECLPVIHGRWIPQNHRDSEGRIIYHCSQCDFEVKVFPYNVARWRSNEKYCAGCGSRMDGD